MDELTWSMLVSYVRELSHHVTVRGLVVGHIHLGTRPPQESTTTYPPLLSAYSTMPCATIRSLLVTHSGVYGYTGVGSQVLQDTSGTSLDCWWRPHLLSEFSVEFQFHCSSRRSYQRGILEESLVLEEGEISSVLDITDMVDYEGWTSLVVLDVDVVTSLPGDGLTVLSSYALDVGSTLLSRRERSLRILSLGGFSSLVSGSIDGRSERKLLLFYDYLHNLGFEISGSTTTNRGERDVDTSTTGWDPELLTITSRSAADAMALVGDHDIDGITVTVGPGIRIEAQPYLWSFTFAVTVEGFGQYVWFDTNVGGNTLVHTYVRDTSVDPWISIVRVRGLAPLGVLPHHARDVPSVLPPGPWDLST